MGSNWNQSTTIRYNRGYCGQTPFKKPKKGSGNTAINCLVCMLCTVRANQFAEFSYVMLMATFVIRSVHKLVSSNLTKL